MLPFKNRLTKKKDFETVFTSGATTKNGFLVFKSLKNNLSHSRFGFVVSKKVSPKATVRNLVKRRLRSITTKWINSIGGGVDYIIIATPGSASKTFLEFKEVAEKVFKKLIAL